MTDRSTLTGPVKPAAGAILVLALALFLSTRAVAQSSNNSQITDFLTSQPLDPQIAKQLEDVMTQAEQNDVLFRMQLTRRVDFYFYISDRIDSLMKMYSNMLIPFIYQKDLFQGNSFKNTPALIHDPMMTGLLNLVISILQPFYAVAILATGVYLLFISGSPRGRAKAKSTLVKMVLGLGLITLTLPIADFLLESSHYLTSTVIAIPDLKGIENPIDTNMFMVVKEFFVKYFLRLTFFDVLSGLPFVALLLLLPLSVLAVLAFRYFMVLMLVLAFPFTVLFYSFMSTKKIGRSLVNQTFIWFYVPVIDAVMLLTTWTAYTSVTHITGLAVETLAGVGAFILLAGFVLLIFAPFIAIWIAGWINSIGLVSALLIGPFSSIESYFEEEDIEDAKEEDGYKEIKDEVGE